MGPGPGSQRLHTMLEAQFRDAGCKLSDLDIDALDSLKAMDPPCREAAVKVLSVFSFPSPRAAADSKHKV